MVGDRKREIWPCPRGGAEHSATPGTFFVSESSNNK